MSSREQQDVTNANEAFYSAFESLDIKAMEKVWSHESYIQCIHPGWGILKGWDHVNGSWRRIFENTEEIHFMLSDVQVEIHGSLAWVTLYENITSRTAGEIATGVVLTTNIFEKCADRWFIIHHHGSTVANPPEYLNPSTFH